MATGGRGSFLLVSEGVGEVSGWWDARGYWGRRMRRDHTMGGRGIVEIVRNCWQLSLGDP